MRVVVTGLIATYPLGGVSWDYLAYVRGFQALGCDVLYLEDTGQWFYDPRASTFTPDPSFNARYLEQALDHSRLNRPPRWALRSPDGLYHGSTQEAVAAFCANADLFLNVSGACWLRDWYRGARCVAYLDTDPGYTQAKLWAVEQGVATEDQQFSVGLIRQHTHFFTLAENMGADDCLLPRCGLEWRRTRQPIYLADWPVRYTPKARWYSTVMSWKIDIRPPTFGGVRYGDKDVEFLKFVDLPQRTSVQLRVALSGAAPRDQLVQHGWALVDGYRCSRDMRVYQRFLQRSRGEWSVAKNAYVATRSGWFATRSASYLASGKPVVLQDTGFSRYLPVGNGLFAFRDLEEAVAAFEQIESAYRHHCDAARALAEQHFAAERVLTKLLADCGLA
ncbi:MAG: glycosyltransferase family 1 protein [Candidatus Binatia bacterium]|nr:glycosyltransferase family 1 protein [Candidatus Binatia bacterium]